MYQKRDLDFTDVNPLLEATVQSIRDLKESKTGATLRKFLLSAPGTPTEGDDGLKHSSLVHTLSEMVPSRGRKPSQIVTLSQTL